MRSFKVLIYGAGAIGGYLGGTLAAAGTEVVLLGRPSVAERLQEHGMRLTDYEGRDRSIAAPEFVCSLQDCPPCDLVLLTVKCTGVAQAAEDLAGWLDPSIPVFCLQNGVGSKKIAALHLAEAQLFSGMVPFNVLTMDEGRLHRGTEGSLMFQEHPYLRPLLEAWNRAGVPAEIRVDFEAISWGKLLLNLNNAINALAGVPLVEELSQLEYRQVLAEAMRELLAALRAAGIQPAKLAKLPPHMVPKVLTLPNRLFRALAKKMLAMDPLARSSMWDDLERRRGTEIDFLNGAVVELARAQGLEAPVNSSICELIKEAEEQGEGSPGMSSAELMSRVF